MKRTSVSPPSAVAGTEITVTASVRNEGAARAAGSVIGYWLSKDRNRGKGDVKLPTSKISRVAPKSTRTASRSVVLPVSTAAGTYRVIACADVARKVAESRESNNCKASTTSVEVTRPGSHELIDRDLESGAIDEETALVFKVFSDFEDPRLPAKYEAPPTGIGDGALAEVVPLWDSLSAETQTTLRPFLIPPFYAGSHWSPASPARPAHQTPPVSGGSPWCTGSTDLQPLFNSFNHIDSADGTIRIWWLQSNASDATTATHLMGELENKIMPALTSLMGRGPLPDGGGYCDGGSAALDIALVDAKTATTFSDKVNCSGTSSAHMLFPRTAASAGWAGLDPYLAHEIMHAIQYSFPVAGSCTKYQWLREATAEWVQDYVTDPAYGIGVAPDDTEFQAARIYMGSPETSLDVISPPSNHDYGAYMLPFYAARRSSPGFVKDVWTNAGSNPPLDAVEKALPADFKTTWPDFALANWNSGPVRDYRDWDGLTASPKLEAETTVPLDAGIDVNTNISYLSAKYYRFDFASGVKTIHFYNPFVGQDHVSVRAILTFADGTQKIEDWSDRADVKFCRDLPEENVREVTIIVANASKDPAVEITDPFSWTGEKQGCVCRAPGMMTRREQAAGAACPGLSGTYTWTHNSSFSSETGHGNSNGTLTVNLNIPPFPDDPETDWIEGEFNWVDEDGDGSSGTYTSTSYGFGDDGFCTLETEETYTGGEIIYASADTDEELKTLWVDFKYKWDWTKRITYGGDCSYLGTVTGEDSGTSDVTIMAEGNGDGTWTYHSEHHSTTESGQSDTVEDATFTSG